MSQTAQKTAQQMVDVVPLVMRVIRTKLREKGASDVSVPQFRSMAYINSNDGASLSDLAAHIGLTLPSMSKLVDGLVQRGFVTRDAHQGDRRRICLALTPKGKEELDAAYKYTYKMLAERMSGLSAEDCDTVMRSMQILRELFQSAEA